MFSGIVETVGEITQLIVINDCLEIVILPRKIFNDLNIGDSVSVNGVCLTVTKIEINKLHFTSVPETLRLTNLSLLSIGSKVNLERSLAVNSRIGGHYVQGHIDFCGEITSLYNDGKETLIARISYPEYFGKYIINKGFITLDGMSITVIDVEEKWLSVTFIPHTQQNTVVCDYQIGTKINIEVDMMGKYIEKLVGAYSK